MGPKFHNSKKWLVTNFIFKGWKWCIWTITTIIHHQIWSADSTAEITVIQSSKLSTLRSTFGRVPLNFFNRSGWNYFNFYIYFWISLKNLTDHDIWPPFWPSKTFPKSTQHRKNSEKNPSKKNVEKQAPWNHRNPSHIKLFGTPADHPTTLPMISTSWSAPRRPNHQSKSFNLKCFTHVSPNAGLNKKRNRFWGSTIIQNRVLRGSKSIRKAALKQ